MNLNLENIYGIYELQKIEGVEKGTPTKERARAGMYTFRRDHRLSAVCGSNEMFIAYTGSFEFKEDTLFIHAEVCNFPEREGSTMTRKIIRLDEKVLTLEARNDGKGSWVHLTWVKKVSL